MRGIISLIIFSLILITAPSCSHHANKWAKYTGDRNFTVILPGTPVVRDVQEITPFGKQTVHYVTWKPATLDLNKFKLVQISYTDCPARFTSDSGKQNVALDSSINMRKRDFTDNEIISQPVDINGDRGRAFFYDPPKDNLITIVKQVIANHKRYDITVIAKKKLPYQRRNRQLF